MQIRALGGVSHAVLALGWEAGPLGVIGRHPAAVRGDPGRTPRLPGLSFPLGEWGGRVWPAGGGEGEAGQRMGGPPGKFPKLNPHLRHLPPPPSRARSPLGRGARAATSAAGESAIKGNRRRGARPNLVIRPAGRRARAALLPPRTSRVPPGPGGVRGGAAPFDMFPLLRRAGRGWALAGDTLGEAAERGLGLGGAPAADTRGPYPGPPGRRAGALTPELPDSLAPGRPPEDACEGGRGLHLDQPHQAPGRKVQGGQVQFAKCKKYFVKPPNTGLQERR